MKNIQFFFTGGLSDISMLNPRKNSKGEPMKTLLILSAMFLSRYSYAQLPINETELKAKIYKHFDMKETFIEGLGGCSLENNKVECEWYIEDGRTPDTIFATFEEIDGEYKIVEAHGEYGC